MNLASSIFDEMETAFSRRGLSTGLDGAQYYAAAENVRGLAGSDFGTSAPAPRAPTLQITAPFAVLAR
jgi:hypothetical protein